MSIKVQQHRGKTVTGETQGHPFDDVVWTDGDKPPRRIAVVHHGDGMPIQYEEHGIPEAVKAEVQKAVAAEDKKRRDRETKARERADAAANGGKGRPERTN